MTNLRFTLRGAVAYLAHAYYEDPQDVDGINRAIDILETQFGFWYTNGGLECQPCWRAGKPGVMYSQFTSAQKHASEHRTAITA
jgi:hypothetical protein